MATTKGEPEVSRGVFGNGMHYVTWGSGPRTLLFLPGGPGSMMPAGMMLRMYRRQLAPYVARGYRPWIVSRRWHMPTGYSMADMADDHAQLVHEEFGGQVALVIGESYGGCVAQHLAAGHPALAERVVLVVAACRVSPEGLAIDRRMTAAIAERDATDAGEAFAEYLIAGERWRPLRRAVGRVIGGRVLASQSCPVGDVVVEFAAEEAFDSEDVLGRIRAPVLMICGERDRFFTPEVVERTAAAIGDCTLVRYAGKGHVATASSARVARDVLAFAEPGIGPP